MYRTLFLSLSLFLVNVVALAKPLLTIESSIQETINDSIVVNILKTNSDQISIVLNIDTIESNNTQFHSKLSKYSYNNGLVLTRIGNFIGYSYSLTISNSQLIDLLRFLRKEQSSSLNSLSKLHLNVAGNINEQKFLGNFYSHWDTYPIDSKFSNAQQDEHIVVFPDELYKDKKLYWTWVMAALIQCEQHALKNSSYELTYNTFKCVPSRVPSIASDGSIANLKSNYNEYLNIELDTAKGILQQLSKFRMTNNYDALNDFKDIIPSLSIESISQIYHSLLSLAPQVKIDNSNKVKNPVSIVASSFGNLQFIDSDETVWKVGLFFSNKQNLCEILNCDSFGHSMEFQYIDGQSQGLLFKFSSNSHEKYISLIHDLVIKPLVSLDSSLYQDDISLLINGTDNIVPFDKILSSLSLLPLSKYKVGNKPSNSDFILSEQNSLRYCYSDNLQGTINWSKNILLSYSLYSVLNRFEEWNLLESSCLPPIALESMTLLEKVEELSKTTKNSIASISENEFQELQQAVLNRLKLQNQLETQILLLSSNLPISSKEYLIEQLTAMSFAEYKHYLSNTILNNTPRITYLGRNEKIVPPVQIKSYSNLSK